MPRYLRVADIPAILTELQGERGTPYQLDAWQKRWCEITNEIYPDTAVLSYRWRVRGKAETLDDLRTWLADCGQQGYSAQKLTDGPVAVDWSLVNNMPIQIEVAAWLLWLHTNSVATYVWVDQMCVPQDADLEEKMGHIKDSPAIYKGGKVYVVLPPVVDYASGRILNAADAKRIVADYTRDMDAYLNSPAARGAAWRPWMSSAAALGRSAAKALLVNVSYMRRIWTIQEAVAATSLNVWPLLGSGELSSYQSLRVMDWPEFNAWNGHPGIGELSAKGPDKVLNDYRDGDYTGLLRVLREHPAEAIGYLASASKELMWSVMDRNGLVNDLRHADTPGRRAFVVLNNHQVHAALSFLPEDRVLALVPLVDYAAWKEATAGVRGSHLMQASVNWAYDIMFRDLAMWKWSLRVYNHPNTRARGLEQLQPRRNLTDGSSMHGTLPGESVQIPPAGGTLTLPPPPPPPPAHPAAISAFLAETGALAAAPLTPTVVASLFMPHPGWAGNWGEGPWKHVRDALTTDENFRLTVQWVLEPWREQTTGLDLERAVAVVAEGGGLAAPSLILLALPEGGGQPSTGQVMAVVDVAPHLRDALLAELRRQSLGEVEGPLTAASEGITPPPPQPTVEPAPTEPEWQVVSMPKPATPPGASLTEAEPSAAAAAPAAAGSEVEPAAEASHRSVAASARSTTAAPAAAAPPAEADTPPTADVDSVAPNAVMQKGATAPTVPHSGLETAAGAQYAGQAPVAGGEEGPCKSCIVS